VKILRVPPCQTACRHGQSCIQKEGGHDFDPCQTGALGSASDDRCCIARVGSSPARADDLTQVVVRGSNTRTIGYDYHTLKPIEESSVTVGVRYDPVTLTTRSGVALLKEAVAEAAIKACSGSDVSTAEYLSCVRRAIERERALPAEWLPRWHRLAPYGILLLFALVFWVGLDFIIDPFRDRLFSFILQ